MKKSQKFNNILDECLERLLVKGETIEQCLRSYPEQADELESLLQTALATKQASAIQPRPEFRAKARYQFRLALQAVEPKKRLFSFGWQPRWATAVAIILVLLLAGGSTVAAAGNSMPDSPLYPVKLAIEQVRLTLTPSALGKAEFYAKLADRRVLEIVQMADENKPEQIEQTAHRLDTYLTKIVDLASTQQVTGGIVMAPATKEALEVEEAPSVREAPAAEEAVDEAPLLPERAEDDQEASIVVDRWARLRATVVRYAIDHPARLRALLTTAPESVKPVLLQAIAISETGYEKALESLD